MDHYLYIHMYMYTHYRYDIEFQKLTIESQKNTTCVNNYFFFFNLLPNNVYIQF